MGRDLGSSHIRCARVIYRGVPSKVNHEIACLRDILLVVFKRTLLEYLIPPLIAPRTCTPGLFGA